MSNFPYGADVRDKIQALIDLLGDAQSLATLEEPIGEVMAKIYDEAIQKYRPLLDAAPQFAEKVSHDLGSLVVAVLQIRNTVYKDPRFVEVDAEINQLRAEDRSRMLKAYMGVGFSRPEAMALLLQDIANSHASIDSWMRSGNNAARKNS